MSRAHQPVPGFSAVLISLPPIGLVFCFHLLAGSALAGAHLAAAMLIGAASWMLTSAVVLGFWGAAGMRGQIHDLQHRLDRALTDPVTGLPVRRIVEDTIAAAGPGVVLTVALVDVDRLHDINRGSGGYAAGDHVLAHTARLLRLVAADGDVVARLGGDEFVLVAERSPGQLVSSLGAVFGAPVAVAGIQQRLEVSIGVCQLPGGDPHQLLGCADLAMLTAKKDRTRLAVYDAARDGRPLPPGTRPDVRPRSGD